MKVIKRIIVVFSFSVLICLFTIVTWYHFLENPKSSYSNYHEVVTDGAIKRGWIPGILPKSAYDIKEEHNLHEYLVIFLKVSFIL